MPRPALTPGQRLHLEINGYVVVEDVFSKTECEAMIAEIFAIEEALHASADPATWVPHPASHMQGRSHEFFRVDNLPHLSPLFFDFITHPRIRGFGEEACGGRIRLGQSDAHIHRGVRQRPKEAAERIAREGGFGFHGGCKCSSSYFSASKILKEAAQTAATSPRRYTPPTTCGASLPALPWPACCLRVSDDCAAGHRG